MNTQTEAQRLAKELLFLPHTADWLIFRQSAAELLRLESDFRQLMQKHNALHINARASRDRVAELEAANAELLTALVDVSYTLEKARIWGGMEWKYNPLHPVHYLPARDKARAAIKKHGGK